MFPHTAYKDFEVLASQLLGDGSKTTESLMPYAMFLDPQLGRMGLGECNGFIKVVVGADADQILGAAVLAAEGAELVHAYIALMNAGAPYTVLDRAVHIHPTLSEAVKSVVKGLA